jgi:C-terminal peptidase prc
MRMRWLVAWMLSVGVAQAQVAPVPVPYTRSLDLLHDVYMYPDELDPFAMFEEAARRLERRVDWLLVDVVEGRATLRHGDGRQLGTVVITGWDDLAAGLYGLETTAVAAGYHLGDDVDIRLETLMGMTGALDRYTRVLAGERLDRFDTRLKGTLVGIGATLGLRDDVLTAIAIVPGGPAEVGGLLPQDRIVRIDDASTVNMPVEEAVRRIKGDRGTPVRLTVHRPLVDAQRIEQHELRLMRDDITIENVHHEVLEGGVALIAIDTVSQRTVYNLQQTLTALGAQGALSRGLVLDLRNNTGGSMKDSAGVVDAFVTSGNILTTRGPDGGLVPQLVDRIDARLSGSEPMVPMVVLVDQHTASGAEIIAGALKGLGRAVLLGERTYGKGEVQKLYTLEEGVRFKVTVAEYQVAHGVEVAGHGVLPDRVVHRVVLDDLGAHFVGWDPAREEVPWSAIVPMVDERSSWRDVAVPAYVDVPREAARLAVLGATDFTRPAVQRSLDTALATLRVEQERHLTEAFAVRGIDWSPASTAGAAPEATVELTVLPDPTDPSVRIVRAALQNIGPTTLRRTVVRLGSEDFGGWDGMVIPIGAVPSGATARGEVRIRLRHGVDARRDRVVPTVIADRRPPSELPVRFLDLVEGTRPQLRVEARLVSQSSHHVAEVTLTSTRAASTTTSVASQSRHHVAEVTLRNLSDRALHKLDVHFDYPADDTIELLDHAARVQVLESGASVKLRLGVRIREGGPPLLELRLVVKGEEADVLAQWDLQLRATGEVDAREGPQISARRPQLSAPAGPFTLPVAISDDALIESVAIFANGRKLSWDRVRQARVDLRPAFELLPGSNTLQVVATDDDGDVSQRTFRVFGEAEGVPITAVRDSDEPAD